jgi:D-alanyl-D-alanine carboxypeptidase/D-alanyl-D-alanine-endopeptidase (penicillin-binding protein 4)
MKLLLLLILLSVKVLFAQVSVPVPKIDKLDAAIVNLVEDKDLKNASIGFYAIDLDTKEVLGEYNKNMSLVPASVMKLVTTSSALEVIGRKHRFKTTLEYTGEIDSIGVLKGNIFIKGGGDPALGSILFKDDYYKPFFMQVWADSLKSLGIKKIDGAVVGDASFYSSNMIPATWIWGDIANYYGAGANALSYYENMYKITFSSGPNAGDSTTIVKIEPDIPDLEIDNFVKASNVNKDNAYIYGSPLDTYRYIEGTIPKNRSEFTVKGSIPNPPYMIAKDFHDYLIQDSIIITKDPITLDKMLNIDTLERNTICITRSPLLSSIIYWTNIKSHNLFAEHMLNYLGYLKYSHAENNSGTKAVEEIWKSKGIDTDGMHVNDGSGLSRYNAITAMQLVGILEHMKTSSNYKTLKRSLPVAGKSGTLKSMCKNTNAQGRVFAKSGTMTRVKSYAGYVESVNNKNIAFAVIVNNYNCSSTKMRKKLETLFVALAEK